MAAAPALSVWVRQRWSRFDGPGRQAGVDLARGLAVVGMLAAHLLVIDEPFSIADASTWVDVVNGRSSILFATLAGVSIALVTGGQRPLRGLARGRASMRIAVRGAALWVLGVALIATGVPVYVILPAYALLFFLSLAFLGLRARTLFVVAAVCAVTTPILQALWDAQPFWATATGEQVDLLIGWHYPFPVWIAFLLAGLGIGRCDLRSWRVAALLLASGAALAAVGYGTAIAMSASASALPPLSAAVLSADAHSSGMLEVIGSGGFAIAVIGICLLACRTVLRWPAIPLRAVGAMPLTAYTAQLVIWAAIAASVLGDAGDLAGFRALAPFWPMTLGLVAACTLWTLLIGRGPLEAAIDRLSRWIVRDPAGAARVDRLER